MSKFADSLTSLDGSMRSLDQTMQTLSNSMKGILGIHAKMLPALKQFNKSQKISVEQRETMLDIMKKTKPVMATTTIVIESQAKAMDDLGESSKKAEKNVGRVESGLGRFIKNTIRAQEGFKGGMHRLLYGIGGYFKFKNTLDATLSVIDTYIVRPLSGLKDENDKEGAIGRMMFGIGGSFQKTKKQMLGVVGIGKKVGGLLNEQLEHSVVGMSKLLDSDYKSPLERGADKITDFQKRAMEFYDDMKDFQKAYEAAIKRGKKIASWGKDKGLAFLKKLSTFIGFGIVVLGLALKVFAVGFIILGVVFLIVKFMKSGGLTLEKLKDMGKLTLEDMKKNAKLVLAGLMRIKNGFDLMVSAIFGEGSMEDLLNGYIEIFMGLYDSLKGLLLLIITPIITNAIESFKMLVEGMKIETVAYLEKKSNQVRAILMQIAIVASVIAMIIKLVLVVIAGTAGAFLSPFLAVAGAVAAGVAILSLLAIGLMGMFGFAEGGVTKQGVSLVGEKGPELVRLPTGSRVHSNTESKQMMASSGRGGGNNITVNVQGRIGASDSELRQIAQKVGQMINKEINRTTSSRGLGA